MGYMDKEQSDDGTKRYLCEKCRQFFPFTEIQYLKKGDDAKIALCTKCRARSQQEDSVKKKVKDENAGKTPYFCTRCRYKFTFGDKGVTNRKCPFCGKGDKLIIDKIEDINKLIDEV